MQSIKEFCDQHGACRDGRDWALAECQTMADAWARAKPDWLLWVATRPGVLSDRELRLLAVFCARRVQHLLADQRSRDAIGTAERFANGDATSEDLAAAKAAADAAWAAARAAARAAAADAAAWAAADCAAICSAVNPVEVATGALNVFNKSFNCF